MTKTRMTMGWASAGSGLRLLMLAAGLLLPLGLHAQTDPVANPNPNPNPVPNNPQTVPGTNGSQATPGVQRSATPYDSSNAGVASDDLKVMRDKMFLRKAAAGGLAEVQLGKLAAQKASSDDVKKFGQRMADDHSRMNNAIQTIAENMGVMLPAKMGKGDQAEYEKLSGLSGAEFDKEYLTYMTEDHRKDLKEFHDEATSGGDQNLKDAAAIGERVIARHKRMVERLDAANGVTVATGK